MTFNSTVIKEIVLTEFLLCATHYSKYLTDTESCDLSEQVQEIGTIHYPHFVIKIQVTVI